MYYLHQIRYPPHAISQHMSNRFLVSISLLVIQYILRAFFFFQLSTVMWRKRCDSTLSNNNTIRSQNSGRLNAHSTPRMDVKEIYPVNYIWFGFFLFLLFSIFIYFCFSSKCDKKTERTANTHEIIKKVFVRYECCAINARKTIIN